MIICGHRGVPESRPENTIESFQKALLDGATAIEFDVRKCRDEIVVIHDSSVERTTNGKGRVKRLTLEQLKELDAGDGCKIPTLQEVIDEFAGRCQLFIEIKGRQFAHEVAAILSSNVASGKLSYNDFVVICFYPDVLERIKEFDSNLQIGVHLTQNDEAENKGLVNFSTVNMAEDVKQIIERLKPQYILPSIEVISKEMVDLANNLGVKAACWTVKTQDHIHQAIACGVEILIADNPLLVTKIL